MDKNTLKRDKREEVSKSKKITKPFFKFSTKCPNVNFFDFVAQNAAQRDIEKQYNFLEL